MTDIHDNILHASMLSPAASSTCLGAATVRAAMLLVSGQPLGAGISAQAAALAYAGMKAMFLTKVKIMVALVLTVAGLAGGTGLVAYQEGAKAGYPGTGRQVEPPAQVKPAGRDNVTQVIPSVDERLPKGAVMRLGTEGTSNAGWPLTLSFTPDSTSLVAGSWDGLISVWDLRSKQLLKEWDSMSHPVRALALSPDGTTVAGAGVNGEIHLWSKSEGKLVRTLERPQGEKQLTDLLAFSPDGRFLVSAGWLSGEYACAVWVYDVNSGKLVYNLKGPRGERIHIGGFSREGSALTVAFYEHDRKGNEWFLDKGHVLTVDLKTGKEIKKSYLPEPARELSEADYPALSYFPFSSTGKWLVRVGTKDRSERVWVTDIGTGRKKEILRYDVYSHPEYTLAPDERCMAIAFRGQPLGQPLVVVELATGQIRGRYPNPDEENTSVAFAPDGRFLACGKADRTILLWDLTGRMEDGRLRPIRLSAKDLARLWRQLQASDGETTCGAIWELVAGGGDAVSFLEQKLRPKEIDRNRIGALLRDLGSASFEVRAKAIRELEDCGEVAEPSVRKKLDDAVNEAVTLEVRRRLEQVLANIDFFSVRYQGIVRAVEVLEHIASPEARRVLQELSVSETSPRLADETKRALRRLERREKS